MHYLIVEFRTCKQQEKKVELHCTFSGRLTSLDRKVQQFYKLHDTHLERKRGQTQRTSHQHIYLAVAIRSYSHQTDLLFNGLVTITAGSSFIHDITNTLQQVSASSELIMGFHCSIKLESDLAQSPMVSFSCTNKLGQLFPGVSSSLHHSAPDLQSGV
jgi:hypothetical protein